MRTVAIRVSVIGDVLLDSQPSALTFEFDEGERTGARYMKTVAGRAGSIQVSIRSGTGYSVGSPSSVTVVVTLPEPPPPTPTPEPPPDPQGPVFESTHPTTDVHMTTADNVCHEDAIDHRMSVHYARYGSGATARYETTQLEWQARVPVNMVDENFEWYDEFVPDGVYSAPAYQSWQVKYETLDSDDGWVPAETPQGSGARFTDGTGCSLGQKHYINRRVDLGNKGRVTQLMYYYVTIGAVEVAPGAVDHQETRNQGKISHVVG